MRKEIAVHWNERKKTSIICTNMHTHTKRGRERGRESAAQWAWIMKYSHWNCECQLMWKFLAANRLSTQMREKKEILFGISTFNVMEFEVISFDAQRNKSAKRPNFFSISMHCNATISVRTFFFLSFLPLFQPRTFVSIPLSIDTVYFIVCTTRLTLIEYLYVDFFTQSIVGIVRVWHSQSQSQQRQF